MDMDEYLKKTAADMDAQTAQLRERRASRTPAAPFDNPYSESCEWFARCTNRATRIVSTVLGDVASCDRCQDVTS